MDAPLVLTSQLNPSEIDDEVYNMEVARKFPLEFFERTLIYEDPKVTQKIIDIVEHHIGCDSQFEGLGFTHPTSNINKGPKVSRYKELKSVKDMVRKAMRGEGAVTDTERTVSRTVTPPAKRRGGKVCK